MASACARPVSLTDEGNSFLPQAEFLIAIGHEPPADVPEVNWLPAPAGPFGIVMRAYLPHTEWLDGIYRMPPLQPAD